MNDILQAPPQKPSTHKPVFSKYPLNQILRVQSDGYAWTKGVHTYSELRPVDGLRLAEGDLAQKYLKLIEAYTQAGIQAAKLFGLELLEVQNNVLHFHKEGPDLESTAHDALCFSYVFTKVLYEVLAEDLGGHWRGFAICMDYGESIIVRRGQSANSSAISLGPSANRPAKRLLYGKTAAGHVEFPASWAHQLLGRQAPGDWFSMNLRDTDNLPVLSRFENAELESQLRRAMLEVRQVRSLTNLSATPFVLAQGNSLIEQGRFSTDRPLSMSAICMRVDLDNFSSTVQSAFRQGEEAVEAVAQGFLKILEFGDYFEKKHYGVVRLPWGGDSVAFIIPPTGDLQAFRGREWVALVEEWQSFAANTPDGRAKKWGGVFKDVGWAIGMSYADDGWCLVAPIETESRKFLIAAGGPLTLAFDAQNLGKAGETVIHNSDYAAAYPILRKLFEKVSATDFWKSKELTVKKIHQAAIEAGRSENASKIEFVKKATTVSVPPPRPYSP
jgi:hypothetical protein